jgi:hypothetical protein
VAAGDEIVGSVGLDDNDELDIEAELDDDVATESIKLELEANGYSDSKIGSFSATPH